MRLIAWSLPRGQRQLEVGFVSCSRTSGYVTGVFEGGPILPVTVVRHRSRLPSNCSESGEHNRPSVNFVERYSVVTAALADLINQSRSRNSLGGGLAFQTC